MLLQNKTAIIYGASPSLGGAIARSFAAAGANVFVTHKRLEVAQKVANEINTLGGFAEAAEVDALEAEAIVKHLTAVKLKTGHIDIIFNLIGWNDTQDIPLTEMDLSDFERPVHIALRTQFLTATAAGRIMMEQGSGIILSLTATPGGIGYANVGGFGPACCAVESFSRNLAAELGPHGVRAVNIRSAGSPDSRPFKEALKNPGEEVSNFFQKMKDDTMLKQLPMMEDISNTAVFLASDLAGKITGVTIDVTAGTTTALNYKVTKIPFV